MALLGGYEIVDEVSSSGPFTVYQARAAAGGDVRFAVKTVRAKDELADAELVAAQVASFERAVDVQERMGAIAGSNWAGVLERGRTEEVSFYAMDLAGSTLERVIQGRRTLDGRAIAGLSMGVVSGLEALARAMEGRGHGALKPSNVLLVAADASRAEQVRLVDAVAPEFVTGSTRTEDLRELGKIIYGVVSHKAAPAGGSVQKGPEWAALGKAGEPLRLLCEQLLNVRGEALPSFEELRASLMSVEAAATPRSKLPVVVGGVAALLALVAGGYFVLRPAALPPMPPPPPVQFVTDEKGDLRLEDVKEADLIRADLPDSRPALRDQVLKGLAAIRQNFEQRIGPELEAEGGEAAGREAAAVRAALADPEKRLDALMVPDWSKLPDTSPAPADAPPGPRLRDPVDDAELARHRQGLLDGFKAIELEYNEINRLVNEAARGTLARRKEFLDAAKRENSERRVVQMEPLREALGLGLEAIKPDGSVGWVEARERVAGLTAWAKAMERELSPEAAVVVPEGFSADLVKEAAETRQREIVRALIDGVMERIRNGEVPKVGEGEVAERARAARAELEAWNASATAVLRDADRARTLLDLGMLLDEAGPGGTGSLATAAAGVRGSTALEDLRGVVGPVLTRVERLEAVSKLTASSDLVRALGEALGNEQREVSAAMAAWVGLSASGYPGTPGELREVAGVWKERLRPALEGVRDADRRATLLAMGAERLSGMWVGYVHERAGPAATSVSPAFEAMGDFGVSAEEVASRLEPWAVVNFERWRLMREAGAISVPAGQAQIDEVSRVVVAFDQRLAGASEGVQRAAGVAEARRLREVVLRPYRDKKYFEAQEEGPGKAGWTGQSLDEDNLAVRYTWGGPNGASWELTFLKLPEGGASDPVVYVSTTEVPVGLFRDVVQSNGAWGELASGEVLEPWSDGEIDGRRGPRVWTWQIAGGRATFGVPSVSAGEEGRTGNGWFRFNEAVNVDYRPGGQGLPALSERLPMAYVPAGAAVYVASAVGCRLPTPGEWQAALAMSGGDGRAGANLRDQSWLRVYEHVRGLQASAANQAEWPNGGVFRSNAEGRVAAEIDSAATAEDDGSPFMREVPTRADRFVDLVGNVAEYVFEDRGRLDGIVRGGVAGAAAIARDRAAPVRVIGGSAMSPPDRSVSEAMATRRPSDLREGFSDVGFRLAFTATGAGGGGGTPAVRLARTLAEMPYLTRASMESR